MSHIPAYFAQIIAANSLQDWLLAAFAFLFTFTVLPLLRGYVRRHARTQDTRERPMAFALLFELIQSTSQLFRLTVALYLAEKILTLPGRTDRVFDVLKKWRHDCTNESGGVRVFASGDASGPKCEAAATVGPRDSIVG